MTIIVEDGSIVPNSNSYVDTTELDDYASARGVTIPSEDLEQYLIRAMDYVESLGFKGYKYTEDQSLQWPREEVIIDGFEIDVDEIPKELKNGLMATAIAIFEGFDPLAPIQRAIKRKKTDVLETEYMDNAVNNPIAKTIRNQLQKVLRTGGNGANTIIVGKG